MGEHVRAGGLNVWAERRGTGPDVLLIAGLGDPAEAWQFQRSIDAFLAHDTTGRLTDISAPALVLAGGLDMITPPRHGRAVADGITGARFEVLTEEAHQPFQESPDLFNARVDAFWREMEGQG